MIYPKNGVQVDGTLVYQHARQLTADAGNVGQDKW